jgi:hypothetical protein
MAPSQYNPPFWSCEKKILLRYFFYRTFYFNPEFLDHLIWHCERFGSERHRLMDALSALDVQHGTPVRDLCGLRKWSAIKCCLDFLESFRIRFWSDSLSVDVEIEICFIGPYMASASASGPSRIRVTFKKKKKKKKSRVSIDLHLNWLSYGKFMLGGHLDFLRHFVFFLLQLIFFIFFNDFNFQNISLDSL